MSKPNFALLYRVAKGEQTGQPGASNMRELVWDDELEAFVPVGEDETLFFVFEGMPMGWT